MTISLLAVEIKHERRVRLVFSETLGVAAFSSTSYYTITSLDDRSPSPAVSAAMLVPGSPAVVELALASPLAKGGLYSFAAVAVPAFGGSFTTIDSSERVRYSLTTTKENVEPAQRNRERLLYGVDLLWNGQDYQETSSGDLERVGGTANVTKALNRRVEANGLPWDSTFGVGAREFVDSPSVAGSTLRGKFSKQILKDPRVRDVEITVEFSGENTFLHATPKLISGEAMKPVSIVVPSNV